VRSPSRCFVRRWNALWSNADCGNDVSPFVRGHSFAVKHMRILKTGLVPFGVATLFGLVAIHGAESLGLIQVRDPRPLPDAPVPTVASEDALRARTPEDRALAVHFDMPFLPNILSTGNVGAVVDSPRVAPGLPGAPPPDPWTDAVCGADAVMIGHAVSERVLLNRAETFLITVSNVSVDRWLRPKTGPETLTMATEGGKVKVGERLLTATINGETPNYRGPWLLTLKRLPGDSAFVSFGPPVPLGKTLPAKGGASGTPSPWKATETRVARIAATCGDKR
jgi:hypothetical protein